MTGNGSDALIRLDVSRDGAFQTVATMRDVQIRLGRYPVDITTLDIEGIWREMMGGADVRSVDISGSAVFSDASTAERIRKIFFGAESQAFQVIVPGSKTFQGLFMVASLKCSRGDSGDGAYDVALASSGPISLS